MPRVFISHANDDRLLVETKIIPLLRKNGIDTWYAPENILAANEWESCVKGGLRACDWFMVVMGPNAVTSEWVKDEVDWAIKNRRDRIVPVLIEDCNPFDIHMRLPRIQHVDFSEPSKKSEARLLAAFTLKDAVGSLKSGFRALPENEVSEVWSPKVVRLGLAWGVLSAETGHLGFSQQYLDCLCETARKWATEKIETFLDSGMSELFIDAGFSMPEEQIFQGLSSTTEMDGDVALLFSVIVMPLLNELTSIAAEAKLISVAADGHLLADLELEKELFEMMAVTSEDVEIKRFIVDAHVELITARLLISNPDRVKYRHLIALYLCTMFEKLHDELVKRYIRPEDGIKEDTDKDLSEQPDIDTKNGNDA